MVMYYFSGFENSVGKVPYPTERERIPMIFTNVKNLKILLDRYLTAVTFIISKKCEDSVGKIPYTT